MSALDYEAKYWRQILWRKEEKQESGYLLCGTSCIHGQLLNLLSYPLQIIFPRFFQTYQGRDRWDVNTDNLFAHIQKSTFPTKTIWVPKVTAISTCNFAHVVLFCHFVFVFVSATARIASPPSQNLSLRRIPPRKSLLRLSPMGKSLLRLSPTP